MRLTERHRRSEQSKDIGGAPPPPGRPAPVRLGGRERPGQHRSRIESRAFPLTGTTMYRWRIPDRRPVTDVVRELEADGTVKSAQPNYIFSAQEQATNVAPDTAQYAVAKLHVLEAQAVTRGDNV